MESRAFVLTVGEGDRNGVFRSVRVQEGRWYRVEPLNPQKLKLRGAVVLVMKIVREAEGPGFRVWVKIDGKGRPRVADPGDFVEVSAFEAVRRGAPELGD